MTEKPEKCWKELRFYQKLKYVVEILAIAGGFIVIFFYSRELTILKNQLKSNEKELNILAESLNLERLKSKAHLECRIWGRDLYVGGQDDRTRIILICRNLSPRATAVIDINVRDEKGGHLGAGGRGYMDRIKLPFRIDSWGLTAMNFIIEQDDEKRMKDILIKDMEDNEYKVTLSSKWAGASQKTRSK